MELLYWLVWLPVTAALFFFIAYAVIELRRIRILLEKTLEKKS